MRREETYSLLESEKVARTESVCLCNDRNEVDTGAQTLHDFNIERLQAMAGGSDEVETGVNTEVNLIAATWLLLLKHVRLVLVVKELDDGLPRVAVVDVVSEARGVNDGEADLEELLL